MFGRARRSRSPAAWRRKFRGCCAWCGSRRIVDVLPLNDGEGLHDVLHIVADNAVEEEVGRIQLAPQQEPSLFVPSKWRPIVAAISRKGFQVPSGVGQLALVRGASLEDGLRRPRSAALIGGWGEDRELFKDEVCERSATHFLTSGIVEREARGWRKGLLLASARRWASSGATCGRLPLEGLARPRRYAHSISRQ